VSAKPVGGSKRKLRNPGKKAGKKNANDPRHVGVIGLGIMGSAMSANLVKAGFTVQGYDVLAARRDDAEKSRRVAVSRRDGDRDPCRDYLPAERRGAARGRRRDDAKCIVVETSTLPIDEKDRARDVLSKKGITCSTARSRAPARRRRTRDLTVYGSGDRGVREDQARPRGLLARALLPRRVRQRQQDEVRRQPLVARSTTSPRPRRSSSA
jgi:hypothetical protein